MIMVNAVIKDYINMDSEEEFRNTYKRISSDEDRFESMINEVEFENGYISRRHRLIIENASNIDNAISQIRDELEEKELPDDFINSYIEAISDEDIKHDEAEDTIPYLDAFTYEGRQITQDDLKNKLDRSKFDIIDEDVREAAVQMVTQILSGNRFPELTPGLESIVEYGSRQVQTIDDSPFDTDRYIGRLDWKLRHRREKAYDYWEGVNDKFDVLVDALKEFIDKIDDLYEDANHQEINNELKEQFEHLKEFYEKISQGDNKYNYVKKYNLVSASIQSPDVRNLEQNAHDMLNNFFTELFTSDSKYNPETKGQLEEFEEEQHSYESAGQTFDVEEGKNVTVAPQVSMEGQDVKDDEQAEIEEAMHGIQVDIKSLEEVDPLFAWILNEGAFPRGAFNLETAEAMSVQVRNILRGWEIDEDVKRQFNSLHEELDKLAEYAVDAKGPYYLPMNIPAVSVIGTGTETWDDSYHEVEDAHYEFLDVIGELMESPHDRTRTNKLMTEDDWRFGVKPKSGFRQMTSEEKQHRTVIRRFVPSKVGGKRDLREYASAFTHLINAIEDYYVIPSSSKYYVWKDLPSFLQTEFLVGLRLKGKGIESKTEDIWSRLYVSMLTRTELEIITNFLTIVSNPITDIASVVASMNETLKVLNSNTLYGDYKRDNENFFAYHLKAIADKNDNIEITERTELAGTPVLTLLQRDINMDKQYPIEELINTIWYFREELEKNQYINESISALLSLIESWGHFTKSELEINLMFAHDEIRKMVGKPIYYSLGVPTSFDNVNATIDLVKSKYKIELSANDVIGIVDEFDSLKSTANKFGVNEEVVYHVKSLYR